MSRPSVNATARVSARRGQALACTIAPATATYVSGSASTTRALVAVTASGVWIRPTIARRTQRAAIGPSQRAMVSARPMLGTPVDAMPEPVRACRQVGKRSAAGGLVRGRLSSPPTARSPGVGRAWSAARGRARKTNGSQVARYLDHELPPSDGELVDPEHGRRVHGTRSSEKIFPEPVVAIQPPERVERERDTHGAERSQACDLTQRLGVVGRPPPVSAVSFHHGQHSRPLVVPAKDRVL